MNTILGAMISALIPLIGSVSALFAANQLLEFGDIPTAAWVVIGATGLMSFLKGTQSLTIRRAINKVTNTGDGGI